MPPKQVKFKCTIRKVGTEAPLAEGVECVERDSVLLKIFKGNIRARYELTGEVTVWRAIKNEATKDLVQGQEITDLRLSVEEGETLLVLYNDKVEVVPGGFGTGARVIGGGMATGGYGSGGEVTEDGDNIGGDGQGGDAIGFKKGAFGTAGIGRGGQVLDGTSGDGAGGDFLRRDLKSSPSVPKKRGVIRQ